MNIFSRILVLVLFIFSTRAGSLVAQVGWTKSYKNAVVVSAEKRASEAGVEILRQGGNAVDAAVAVQFTLAVTLPRAGNIGGGGFMVLHLQDGTTRALDFREMAPEEASRNMYKRNGEYQPNLSRRSILASGVPGVVDGMVKAIERYGRLPLESVMAPAIRLAREGYPLSWKQAQSLNGHAESFKEYEASTKYFSREDNRPYQEGDHFVQSDLAETLDRISRMGREGFYSGRTADLIIREVKKHDGIISYRDLRNYDSKWRDVVKTTFNDYTLHIMPPPSSGSIALSQMLTMLSDYNLKELGFNSSRYVHLLTEVMRRAFADRAYYLGDPDFVDVPRQNLTDEQYLSERMQSFRWQRASSSEEIGHGEIAGFSESSQTTHFSIVDDDGSAVSVTTTLNGFFGNKIAVGEAGFLLNNEMDDFTAELGEPNMYNLIQGEANAIEPGKRMLSSMTPVVVTKDGKVNMVLGAAGGPRIITATLMNFLNRAVFGMNAQEAISAPRFHHQWQPDILYYEPFGLSPDTREKLQGLGHRLKTRPTVGRGHIIFVDRKGILQGAPDPRYDGSASGY